MSEPTHWDGKVLKGDILAVVIRTEPCWLLDVEGDEDRCTVPKDRVEAFLRTHAERRFVCDNAGTFHAEISSALEGLSSVQSDSVMWRLADEGHLLDVGLLEELVENARRDAWDGGSACVANGPECPADLLKRYRRLQHEAERLIGLAEIDAATVTHFGPLGLTLEVQARIAAEQVTRRGVLLGSARQDVIAACQHRRDNLVARLLGNASARTTFQLDRDGCLRLDAGGIYPKRHEANVHAWIASILDSLQDLQGLPLLTRIGEKVPTTPADLRALHVIHPLLRTWAELLEICALWRFLDRSQGEELHPKFMLPDAVRTAAPSLDAIRAIELRGPAFRPRERRMFLVVTFEYLPLRALAQTLRTDFGDPSLANLFRGDTPPSAWIASQLQERADQTHGRSLTQAQWASLTQMLLNHVPVGHAEATLRLLLEDAEIRITHSFLHDLCGWIQEVIPGLQGYLRYPAIELMEKRLGLAAGGLAEQWQEQNEQRMGKLDAEGFVRTFFDTGRGTYGVDIVRAFIRRCAGENPSLIPDGDSVPMEQVFANLTHQTWVTPAGGILGDALIWECLGKRHLYLAEIIRKKALYELVRHGHAVCAIVGDQILIEVDEAASTVELTAPIAQALGPVLGDLLGNLPGGYHLQLVDEIRAATVNDTARHP